ncbi:TlpA family protein disulfide reductase [Lacrimispora sp. NSJ-141]|uniref:TlpA family protein disulfide reductase n=1 Tax=Lientehia hominis TaxID=2897778 RepID=A0AAP2RJM4_9FIRM|nr:TlpA disulfide reductase family protein [Lientehia hominis]MCD2493439.1 TlpA family protein disulfide reductase [Lientehia hominis]
MKLKRLISGAAVILMITSSGMFAGCGAKRAEPETAKEETRSTEEKGTEASESSEEETAEASPLFGSFTSETLDGEAVDQEIFSGADLTMVNIWGTFCGPCISEMPDLGEISEEYKDKGVQVIGIVSDVVEAKDETALEIVNTTGADYTHIVVSKDLYLGYLQEVQVVPTTVFVDKEGKQVGSAQYGAKSKEKWEEAINELLEQVKDER